MKKILFLIPLMFLMQFNSVFAATNYAGYVGTGTGTATPGYYLASGTDLNDYWLSLSVGGAAGTVVWYKYNSDGSAAELGRNTTPANNIKAPAGANAFKLNSVGGEVYAVEGHTSNTNADYVIFTTPSQDDEIFNTPGWAEHMDKLNQILAAIPPAPDWQQVANTFRDTILPKLKNDLKEVLGTAPTPQTSLETPAAPDTPGAPNIADRGNLDNKGLTDPTGEIAPGLDSSGFSADDIKNGAPAIEERQDPTGGFTINNPLTGLPSQEEFMNNIPTNPAVPNVTEPQIGQEPTYTMPTLGQEPTFTMPTFTMPTFTQPTYTMPTWTMPTFTSPSINYNTAPTPSPGGTTADPIKGDFNTAPIPNQNLSAPLPGG